MIAAGLAIRNPPCLLPEAMPEGARPYCREAYPTTAGRADPHVAFFAAALRQFKDGGACSFLCASHWMDNRYGTELWERYVNRR